MFVKLASCLLLMMLMVMVALYVPFLVLAMEDDVTVLMHAYTVLTYRVCSSFVQTTDELGNAILNEVIKTKTGSPWAVKFRHMESFKCIVTRKFLFQLDVRHSGKLLSLHRVAACPAVEELHELLLDQLVYPHENWFFPRAAQQVRFMRLIYFWIGRRC